MYTLIGSWTYYLYQQIVHICSKENLPQRANYSC